MWTSDALLSQSEPLLPRDSSPGVHTATASLIAATPSADSASGLPPVLTALRLLLSHPAVDARKIAVASTQASPLWPEPCQQSSGVPCLRVMTLFKAPQYLTGYCTLCLPARLYTLLLTAINICYRNLRGSQLLHKRAKVCTRHTTDAILHSPILFSCISLNIQLL
jgi:hypothetical protein